MSTERQVHTEQFHANAAFEKHRRITERFWLKKLEDQLTRYLRVSREADEAWQKAWKSWVRAQRFLACLHDFAWSLSFRRCEDCRKRHCRLALYEGEAPGRDGKYLCDDCFSEACMEE
jgi:hypothetical protein